METWYRTSFTDTVVPVSVVRFTEKTVILAAASFRGATERKALRKTSYERYFPTWEEAKGYLIEAAEARIAQTKKEIEETPARLARTLAAREKILDRVKNMDKPEGVSE